MNLSHEDIDNLDQAWINKSRVNFLAFRKYIRHGNFIYNWFIIDLCIQLQKFYIKLINGERPVLVIQTPPQHGKSWTITDFIAWVSGLHPSLRVIFGSYSETLGVRTNLALQRYYDSRKFQAIFPKCRINQKNVVTISGNYQRNKNLLEYVDNTGCFRNTTVQGPVTGETLDLGVIDDPVKGREQANSKTYRDKTWDWFTDDFGTRFDDKAGTILVMTRWHVDDLAGRLIKENPDAIVLNYPAFALKDEEHRKEGEPLFPEHKSTEFLLAKKKIMLPANFQSLYQGKPVILGGNMVKDGWWKWYERLPKLKYKFIVADTAQKKKTKNDWTCFQCWGYGIDNCIYLIDMLREKLEAPELRREAAAFYHKHNTKKKQADDPVLRGFYIEDKSSGTGLIQELKAKKVKVIAVQRNTDKIFRCEDASPEIAAGRVFLNETVKHVGVLTEEAREFPNGSFDDVFDTALTAIEIAFINKSQQNSLKAAMEADN